MKRSFNHFILTSLLIVFGSAGNISMAQINSDRMMIIGRNALYFEDYILAIQYFNHVIKAKPYLSEPYFYRATGKYYLDDYKGAEADCTKALELNPYYVDAYNLRGIVRQKQNRSEEAISDYKKGLEIEPENINLVINIGVSQINSKDYSGAIETYTRAIDLSPNLISAWLNRAYAKLASKDTLGGLDDFSKAISLNPYIPDGFAGRAMVYYQLQQYDKSLDDLNKAIEIRPDEANFYLNRGIIRYQLDSLRGTMADFDKVIELEPRNALAYSNRGILRAQVGDVNRAIDDFSRVLALRSDDYLTLYNRALLYIETGELNKALSDLDIIARIYPDFAPVYFNRSQVKQMLGDNRGAELDYGTAVKLEMDRRAASIKEEKSEELAAKDKTKGEGEKTPRKKATRKESDRDISNYDKIAVLDDFGNEEPEEVTTGSLRGRIQNRNIVIDMQPSFVLTYFPGDSLVHRLRYFNIDLDALNRRTSMKSSLEIANQELELSRTDAAQVFATIGEITEKLKEKPQEKADLLMVRAAFYSAVSNLNNAMEDYNEVIVLQPDNYLAWFSRAAIRTKMVEMVQSMEDEIPTLQKPLTNAPVGVATSSSVSKDKERRILDYDLIIADLEKATILKPEFEFAHYNLGMVYALMRDFDESVKHFSQAIICNPEFAEAWFNRGLIRIYLEEEDLGTMDLSKAGELGVFDAYNVIKRYGEKPEDL